MAKTSATAGHTMPAGSEQHFANTKPFTPSLKHYPRKSSSFAASGSDSKSISKRLESGWKAHERTELLQRRVQEYALMHDCKPKELRTPHVALKKSVSLPAVSGAAGLATGGAAAPAAVNTVDDKKDGDATNEAMQILAKVVKDGEQANQMNPAEKAVADYLKSGLRDFIDDALEEVGRYTAISNPGANRRVTSFNWQAAGHHGDNPTWRNSLVRNNITDGSNEEDRVEYAADEEVHTGARPKDVFALDFTYDFCRSQHRWNYADGARRNRAAETREGWQPKVGDAPPSSWEGLRATSAAGRYKNAPGRWAGQSDDEFALTASKWVMPGKHPRFTTL